MRSHVISLLILLLFAVACGDGDGDSDTTVNVPPQEENTAPTAPNQPRPSTNSCLSSKQRVKCRLFSIA